MVLSPTAKQIIFSSASLLSMVNLGMMFGYPAILTPALLDKNSDLVTDVDTASWIASIPGIAGLIPILTLGPLMHVYGRRTAHLVFSVPMLFGWILASVSYSIPTLIIARLLQGFGNGGIYFISVCVGELTSPKIRGIMLNLKTFAVSFGIMCIHLVGFYLHWRTTALIGVIPIALSMLIAIFWPESPEWLVSKHKYQEAETAFFFIRDHTEDSVNEIHNIINREKMRQHQSLERGKTIKEKIKMIKSSTLWRPVILLCCAIVIPEAGGRHYIPAYSIEIVKQTVNDKSNGHFYTFVIDLTSTISSILSLFFVIRYSRRSLGIFCGLSAVVILVLASIVMYLREHIVDTTLLKFLCLTLFGCYFVIVFSCTFAVCYLLMGELLPLEYRPLGTVIDGILASVMITVIIRLIPIMKENLGVHGMFLVFSLIMTAALGYMHYDLPETKNRTLHDIGEYFRGNSTKHPLKKSEEIQVFLSKA